MIRRALGACAAIAVAGCAPQLYDGPRRSNAETALLETDGTFITRVDGKHRGAYDDGRVLPGLRAVSVRLDDAHAQSAMTDWVQRSSRRSVTVCFVARAGGDYVVRPSYAEGGWKPEIVDTTTAQLVDTEPFDDDDRGCTTETAGYTQKHRIPVPLPVPIVAP